MGTADRLRAAGLSVTDYRQPGNGRPFRPRGCLLHHTAGPARGDAPSLMWMLSDAGFPGPKAHALVARSGHVHWLTDGGANHAGVGGGLAAHGIPRDRGNELLWGVEVESTGLSRDWPAAQWQAVHTLARVLANGDPTVVWRHKDYTARKVDTVYDLAAHRAAVAAPVLPGLPPDLTPDPAAPPAAGTPTDGDDEMAFTCTGPDNGTWLVAGVWRRRISWEMANALALLAQPVPYQGKMPQAALDAYEPVA
jgi:hypothetical protein